MFRVGGDVTAPRVIKRVEAVYPDIHGKYSTKMLVLERVITRAGSIRDVKILAGPKNEYSDAIIAALKQWQFEPGKRNGEAVDVLFNVTANHVPYQRLTGD